MSTPKAKDLLTEDFMKKYKDLPLKEKEKIIKELEEKFDNNPKAHTADDTSEEGGANAFS